MGRLNIAAQKDASDCLLECDNYFFSFGHVPFRIVSKPLVPFQELAICPLPRPQISPASSGKHGNFRRHRPLPPRPTSSLSRITRSFTSGPPPIRRAFG